MQARILPVAQDYVECANNAAAKLREAGIRVEVDARDEKLGKKIRDAQLQKVPYMLVIGAKEAENGTLAVANAPRATWAR